jgi:hypothetical protein
MRFTVGWYFNLLEKVWVLFAYAEISKPGLAKVAHMAIFPQAALGPAG